MYKIDWNRFKEKNSDYRLAFERMTYHLFCRKYKVSGGIAADFNQVGLETQPILVKEEEIGFQSKFFDNSLSDKNSQSQIKDSITKAKNAFPKLSKIVIFSHQLTTKENKKVIEEHAKNVSIEWILETNLNEVLNEPGNLDLTQLFFDYGDELGFLKNSVNEDKTTLINSDEYLQLGFDNGTKVNYSTLLSSKNKILLLTGGPGSGKSILMYKLFQDLAGLNEKDTNTMDAVITKNGFIPVLINLKDSSNEELENIIRNRQDDFGIKLKDKLNRVYLLDGLDELTEERASYTLAYIRELSKSSNTSKIIISCRFGNLNKVLAKEYLPHILEFKIESVSTKQIISYFKSKGVNIKSDKLTELTKQNPNLIKDIDDVFLVKLLWDTIENLGAESTPIDIFYQKIDLLLCDVEHRKYLDKLDILNPKKQKIIALNQIISLRLQEKFQLKIELKEIQDIVISNLTRADYRSVNDIVNYILDTFFDGGSDIPPGESAAGLGYTYQHRRYQEFFLAKELKALYEKNPSILRTLKIFSNREFFHNLFLENLKREYKKENNLPRLLELGLINVYSNKSRNWGADDPYYLNSPNFLNTIANQQQSVFEQLLADENLCLIDKILINVDLVKNKIDRLNKNLKDWKVRDTLKNMWEIGLSEGVENVKTFDASGKKEFAKTISDNLMTVFKLLQDAKLEDKIKKYNPNERLSDPFWKHLTATLYYRVFYSGDKLSLVFEKIIRANYPHLSDNKAFTNDKSEKEKAIISFISFALKYKTSELINIAENFDKFEFSVLLSQMLDFQYLELIFSNKKLRNLAQQFVEKYGLAEDENSIHILFYKKLFGLVLDQKEEKIANELALKYLNERHFEWHMYNIPLKYSLLSFVLKRSSFDNEDLENYRGLGHTQYFNELMFYASLFERYINLLKKETDITSIAREYKRYEQTREDYGRGRYLKFEMSQLWANIFAANDKDLITLRKVKKYLFSGENNLILFSFYWELNKFDNKLFNSLSNESELLEFEHDLENWDDDYQSYINRCFEIASLYSTINPAKSIIYISKGINDGILRHGWHKDPIVAYHLVEAFEIMTESNFLSEEAFADYATKIFNLTVRAKTITDGDVTSSGPYNLIKLVSKYNLDLATKLKDRLIEEQGLHNISNSAITDILVAKVNLGYEMGEIEKGMEEYPIEYDYKSNPQADSYEEKIAVYLEIAKSNLYSKKEQSMAFDKAFALVEVAKKANVEYFFGGYNSEEVRENYIKQCKRFEKKSNLPRYPKSNNYVSSRKVSTVNHKIFISKVKEAKTSKSIKELLKQLESYEENITLTLFESWNVLIKQTYKILGNIKPVIKYLESQYFPGTDFYSQNSKYLHFCVAAALRNIDTKDEMFTYLIGSNAHGAFLNLIKAYKFNGDRDMCIDLFEHFYNFCVFLSY